MSIDKTRQCVRSKYFVGKTAMDESLSDFQETKPNCKGPKIIKKVVKTNTRKVTKRIRGQKDIRTALNSKKNELISYSKEFGNICKKSGIDVDSEQLQIAIALSKSLQTVVDDASTSQSLPTHRRATKIRATLQEYGFKVPDCKIKTAVIKKIKKHRKQYILLNTTNEERRQKITNKYSQILLETLDYKSNIASPESSYTPLYSLATDLEYEYMKDNNIFLVDSLRNLVEISVSKGSLLRNWSEIPGRPVSPILFDNTTMDVSEIMCSQDELDIILSGPIKSACKIIVNKKEQIKDLDCDIPKVIVKNKEINTIKEADDKEVDVDEIVTIDIEDHVTKNDDVIKKPVKDITKCNDVIDIVSNTTLPVREQYRSCSPDIFDDEVSYIMETSKPTLSQEHKTKLFTEETNNLDFTGCTNNIEQVDLMIVNVTKMNPDDLMEMTDCAVTASQAIKVDVKEIDLTQSPDEVSLTEKDCDGVHFLNRVTKSLDNTLKQKQVVTNHLDCKNSHKNIDFKLVNATKMDPDDFMEMTDCAVTASQAIKVDVKEIDLTQNHDDVHKTEKNCDGIHFSNRITESSDNSLNERHIPNHRKSEGNHKNQMNDFGLSENSIQQNNKFNKYKSPRKDAMYPCPAIPSQNSITNIHQIVAIGNSEIPSDKIDLSQSFNEEDDKIVTNIEDDITILKEAETGNLTQSSKCSVDINDLPEIIVGNTKKDQNNLDDTVILNVEDYIGVNRKCKNPIVTQNDELFDLTQAGDEVLEQPNDFMEDTNSKVQCQSFYEDFVHDHSDKTSEVSNKNSVHNTSNESGDRDLTQSSDGSPENSDSPKPIDIIPNNSSLGKKDNISIDYDEICEHISDKENIRGSDSISIEEDGLSYKKNDSLKSETNVDVEIVDCNDDVSNSQSSEVFDLIDNELDYSLHKSKLDIPTDKYNFEGTLNIDNDFKLESSKKSLAYLVTNKNNTAEETFLPEINLKKTEKRVETEEKRVETEDQVNACSSQHNVHKMNQQSNTALATPCNSEYIIKTDEVTPMLDYASLTTPQRNKELDKYGLKPFKRKRAIQILTHLYNQTHPVIEPYSDDLQPSPSKKPRPDSTQSSQTSPNKLKSPEKLNTNSKFRVRNSQSPRKKHRRKNNINSPRKELNCNRELTSTYEITCDVPNIRSVDCNPDDWVFQKREKSKIHSCRVPLHIAFHNYVSSRGGLREAILKYEPVNIDVIHKDLVSYGHRYDPKDLLRFLDKKCITVKTTDNNARNKR